MTVMQHERGAVGGISKEVVEDKEDVLSCLHHLRRTLQECHWRVESVDHALCAQGNKSLDGFLNQAVDNYSFQYQADKDYSLQDRHQHEEGHDLKNENGRDYNIQSEGETDDKFQHQTKKVEKIEDHFGKISEQIKDNNAQNTTEEDHNHQNEISEEFKSENLSGKDNTHQKPLQENHSLQDVNRKDECLSLQDKGNNLDVSSDTKTFLPSQPIKDSDLQKATMKESTEVPRPEHHLHSQMKEEEGLFNNTESTCYPDCTNSFQDHSVGATSVVPYIMTDDFQHQLLGHSVRDAEETPEEVSSENCSQSNEVRCRPGQEEECVGSKTVYEGKITFLKNQKTSDTSFVKKLEEDKTKDDKTTVSKISHADTFPEVTQNMDVIWEALEKLQSHFLTLRSSIMDSNHCLDHETNKSLDISDITSVKADKVTKSNNLNEKHAGCEDEAGMLHQTNSVKTEPFNALRERTSLKNNPLRKLSQPVCPSVPRKCNRFCTLPQQPTKEALLNDSRIHTGTFFQGCREGCLCIGMVLLLLLLSLFLASCLLLVLPVVSVSVRTAGGLPAF